MMMHFIQLMLADAVVTHGTQGEVSTITTGAISAIAGGIVSVLVMYFRTRSKVTVDGEVNVKEAAGRQRRQEVSWTEVRDLKDRVTHMERKLDEMKASQGDQFQRLLTSAFEREHRLMEKIEKAITPVHNRIDELQHLLIERKNTKG
jgi:biopolymer transport protein ExbB/TolQ